MTHLQQPTQLEGNTMNSITLGTVEAQYNIAHLEHLDRDAAVPVVSRVAFQGDVALIRTNSLTASTVAIPVSGYPVVRGENGGNTHALYGRGFFTPARASATSLALGVLTVPDGEQVLLSHPEHGGLLIQPGTYEFRRQREQADELRLIAD